MGEIKPFDNRESMIDELESDSSSGLEFDVEELLQKIDDKRKEIDAGNQKEYDELVKTLEEDIKFVNEKLLCQAKDLIRIYKKIEENRLNISDLNWIECEKPGKIGFMEFKNKTYGTIYPAIVVFEEKDGVKKYIAIIEDKDELQFMNIWDSYNKLSGRFFDAFGWVHNLKFAKIGDANFDKTYETISWYFVSMRNFINNFSKFRDGYIQVIKEFLE